jgi:hypothetical protein
MSFVIHIKSKKNDAVYAYEVESFRDPVTKQTRQHRTYLGRVSPETGEIIPKKETRHVKKGNSTQAVDSLPTGSNEQSLAINELSKRIDLLQAQNTAILTALKKIADAIANITQ